MPVLIICARLITSAIFLVAGLAKLAGPQAARKSMEDFGVPRSLSWPAAILLPLLEIAVAIALLPARLAHDAAIAAVGLYAVFILAIVITLARGRRPDCNCFGQLQSKPIGPSLVARNVGFALL